MNKDNGRLEKEIRELNRINLKVKKLPRVIQDYFYYMQAADKSYTTIRAYINYIIGFMDYYTNGNKCEDFYKNITSSTINEYMSSIRYRNGSHGQVIKTGSSIRAARWSALNDFFGFLQTNNLIDSNPMEKTFRPNDKNEKNVTYLTKNEIKKCMNEICKNSPEKFVNRDICIFSLGISTGLRVSAITQINIDDIDFDNNTIHVIEKGNKYRVINFGDNLKEKILAWIDDRDTYYHDIDTNALFISRKRNRISVSAVEDMIERYTQCLNKHITPHKLRATCATNLYKQTGDIYMVANQLGHANISTTKIYTEIDSESKKKAANILDSLI